MTPELQQAVRERVELSYDKAQIVSELQAAGYDDATIEQVYQHVVNAGSVAAPTTAIPTMAPPQKTISPWLVGFAPLIFLGGLICLWWMINLVPVSPLTTLAFLSEVLIPLLGILTLLSIPVSFVLAIVIVLDRRGHYFDLSKGLRNKGLGVVTNVLIAFVILVGVLGVLLLWIMWLYGYVPFSY